MLSKSLFILCIVVIMLPNPFLAGSGNAILNDVNRFRKLYKQNDFLREMHEGGKEFVHPDDPNKIVRIYKLSTSQDATLIMNDETATRKLVIKGNELGNITPIAQKVYQTINFTFEEDYKGISVEMDRYRGTLIDGIKNDPVLRASLLDFPNRLNLYTQLAFIFQQMSALDMKHCNIELDRVLYKKAGDDFSTMPLVETDSDFNFVLSDFRYVTGLGSSCVGGIVATWDQEDALDKIPVSGKCKGKIEIFGLAMLILRIETILLMIKEDGTFMDKDQNIKDAFSMMPDSPPDILRYYNNKRAMKKYKSIEILAKIWEWVSNAIVDPRKLKGGDYAVSGKALLPNLAYVEQANLLIFEQRDLMKYPALGENDSVNDKVVGNYAALN